MKNKKIIRLTENDIQNLVRKIISEGSFKEDTLIEKTYDLLELLGYDYVEDFYIQSLEEAAEILEAETYQHGSILDGEIQNLLTEIYSIIGFPGEDEDDDYMDDEESKLLMSAYNLMERLGYSYEEVEEISEELNDDITLVLSFLKDELISNHGPELNQEIKILMEHIKNYIMEGLKYHADKEGYKITPLPKRKN